MRRSLLAIALVASGCAADIPTYPTPVTVVPSTAPTSIRLTASTRPDYQTAVTATVYTADLHVVPNIPIAFSTVAGTIVSEQTKTDGNGTATAVVASPTTTRVSASIGGTVSSSLEISGSVAPTVPSRPPVVTPDPPAPATPAAVINVASIGTTGVGLLFGVSAPGGQTWTWTFGDGTAAVQTSAYTLSHTYAAAGAYTATVSSAGTTGGRALITISDPAPVAAPPAATLVATISCTPGTHATTATACNLSGLTFGGSPIASTAVTSAAWDFGDGIVLNGLVVSHTYAVGGTYTVLATITANTSDGSKTTTASKSLDVP